MDNSKRASDVAIIGGGLGGLTCAAYLARAGWKVTLYEKAAELGGRARTQTHGAFHLNIGPHAVYRKGHTARVLRDLGVPLQGGMPSGSGGFAIRDGRKHTLPGGFVSLLSTSLLGLSAKLETGKLLASFQKIAAKPLYELSVREWLERDIHSVEVRALLQALFGLSTYANCPDQFSAGVAVEQLQLALRGNVIYADGGWQTLVSGLRRVAEAAGAEILGATRVVAVEHGESIHGVRLADGTLHQARHVVLATTPHDAAALVPDCASLRAWSASNMAVSAACLDVALTRLPQPKSTFALGIDEPLYLSVHSAYARLAPQGGAVIHVAKYLDPTNPGEPKANERILLGLLDLMQPGWRELVVEQRFLPNMTVCNGLATASNGGLAGRPGPAVPGIRNLYVAGDWVGSEGWLADASCASAKQTAELIAQGTQMALPVAASRASTRGPGPRVQARRGSDQTRNLRKPHRRTGAPGTASDSASAPNLRPSRDLVGRLCSD